MDGKTDCLMDTGGLGIVLYVLSKEYKELHHNLDTIKATGKQLDDIEERATALKKKWPFPLSKSGVCLTPKKAAETYRQGIHPRDWETIRREAELNLRERGVDPTSVSLDNLLDPEEVKSIEQRFCGGFSISSRLDKYDVGASVAAGLTAALVDFLIVKIPKDIEYLGKISQKGSPLTKWMRSLSIPEDNWLASYFKVSYDNYKEANIPGMGGKTHRLQAFGHDPLIGLVIGTIDIMRGGLTGISKGGEIFFTSGAGTLHYNPFTALVWQIMHLFSDGFTKMGLPSPGWSALQLFQVGSFGERERTVADIARYMYLNGYDSRHFLTMSTSVAAAEAVLRGYFCIRRKLDEKYEVDVAHEAEVVGAKGTGGHPRFQAMALAAHGIAAAANVGKVAIYAGNPLAINYAQWLRFFHAMFKFIQTKMQSPSDVLKGHARANWKAIEQGWPALDIADPSFPTLVIR